MTRVRPRRGIILAGIPSSGADVDAALAQEWIAAGLVTAVKIDSLAKARAAKAAKRAASNDSTPVDPAAEG